SRLPVLLLSCRSDLFGHQTNLVDPGTFRDVDNLSYVVKQKIRITLNEGCTVTACLEHFLQPVAKIPDFDFILVDLDLPRLVDRHNDGLVGRIRWGGRRPRGRRLWNRRVESFRSQRSDRHEDDEKYEQNVDERGDVDVGLC